MEFIDGALSLRGVWIILAMCILFTKTAVLGQGICSSNEYLCPASYCIPIEQVCDSVNHCLDGADERNCDPMPDCRVEFERCPGPSNAACIYPSWRCDGYDDCSDNSDEDINWCRATDCPDTMIKCTNSARCISGRFLCDGEDDCQDGSGADEPPDYCFSSSFTCPLNHFQCNNGLCIPEHWVCDTDDDCGDRSDEDSHDCSAVTCRPGFFRCRQNQPRRSICIPDYNLCDGLAHCEHAEDELPPVCEAVADTCDVGYFQCNNGLCIPQPWVCDTDNDCGDMSDEGTTCSYSTCLSHEFTCDNDRCINSNYVCDGIDDCQDDSDETHALCGTYPCAFVDNTPDRTLECSNGNTHGSTCTFACTRSGYTICPGSVSPWWTCNNGTWVGTTATVPSCCDTEKPRLACPTLMTRYAGRNTTAIVLSWSKPQVFDNSGESLEVVCTSGNPAGSVFPEGRNIVAYEASDSAGNIATCSFNVTVIVSRCETLTQAVNQRMTCTNGQDNFIYGSTCSFSCISGWCLDGSRSITCENIGSTLIPEYNWTGDQPTCRAAGCPRLIPPPHGYIIGSCSNIHDSTCVLGCNSGYRMDGGRYRRCDTTQSAESSSSSLSSTCLGSWIGQQPTCIDIESPNITCPTSMTRYPDRNGLYVAISWDDPQVLDNSGETIQPEQTSGRSSGTWFPEGQHVIEYNASDATGNAATCSFTVTIIVNRCPALIPASNQNITCSNTFDNFVYGSTCTFTCATGWSLIGSGSSLCGIIGTHRDSFLPIYNWSDEQPTCLDTETPLLSCPWSMTRYAERNAVTAVVYWNISQAPDNSGVIIQPRRISGSPSGSTFTAGQYVIEYDASDSAGNTATCSFSVTVKVHKCESIIPTSNQVMSCTNGEDSFIYGTTCSFSCASGWCLDGDASISCDIRENGAEWNQQQPTCIAIQCPSLSTPQHGYAIGSCSTTLGSTCSFECNPGYQADGDRVRRCIAEQSCLGTWSGRQLVCIDTQAPSLTCPASITRHTERNAVTSVVRWTTPQPSDVSEQVRLTSGRPSGSSFEEGRHLIQYEASDTAGNTARCSFDVTIIVNRCETLTPASNQQMSCSNHQDNFVYGSTCTFNCTSGWCLDGSVSITCENTGTTLMPNYNWSGEQPICTSVQCQPLNPPQNGSFIGSCTGMFGSTCSFGCNSGYQIIGNSNRRCSVDGEASTCQGTWSGQQPICHDTEPPSLTCPGWMARYTEGNSLTAIITWNDVQVDDNSGDNIQPELISGSPSGSTFMEGQHVIEYEASDAAGNRATCSFTVVIIVKRCETLIPTANQQMTCSNDHFPGSTCTFRCASGWCLDGSALLTCQATGTDFNWSAEQPTCQVSRCPDLAPPANADVVSGRSVCSGFRCEMACNRGYEVVSGDEVRHCQLGSDSLCSLSSWSGQELQCQDTEAPHFTACPINLIKYAPQYFQMAYVDWNVAASDNLGVVDVTCNMQKGFMVEGVYHLDCTATDGSGNQAMCYTTITVTVRHCHPSVPALPLNGILDISRQYACADYHGSECWITCQDGFTLQGSRKATCEYDATRDQTYWSWDQPPICVIEVTHCQSLPEGPDPVQYECTHSYNIGSVCTWSCSRPGFNLAGVPVQLTCQADGSWNADIASLQPRCDDIQQPSIDQCPGSIHGQLSPDTLRAEVYYDIPMASDNSIQNLRVVTIPTNVTSPYNFTSDTLVTYQFYDETGNSATCSFLVTVQNNLPPTVTYCPRTEDLHFYASTDVVWQLPRFENPLTREAIIPLCTRQPEDNLVLGEHPITCFATNPDNNIIRTCEFVITVEGTSPCPPLPTLINGYWSCIENMCIHNCNEEYDVEKGTPIYFTCGDNGWLPHESSVKQCELDQLPNLTIQVDAGPFYTSDNCTNPEKQNSMEAALKSAASDSLVDGSCLGCAMGEVAVDCHPEANPRGKRSTGSYEVLECFIIKYILPEGAEVEQIDNYKLDFSANVNVLAAQIDHIQPASLSVEATLGNSPEISDIKMECPRGCVEAAHSNLCVPCADNCYEGEHQP